MLTWRRGFLVTSCLGCGALAVVALFLTFYFLVGSREGNNPLPPVSRKPYNGKAPAYRPTEFQAELNDFGTQSKVFVSSLHDRIRLETGSAACYGPLKNPRQGWTVVIPREKSYIRYWPDRGEQMRKAGQFVGAGKLRDKVDEYAAASFHDAVKRLTVQPEMPAAERWLEERGRFVVEIQNDEHTRYGSLGEGFKKSHVRQWAEFCPELGIIFRLGAPEQSSALELSNIEERPLAAEHFQPPKDYRELFAADAPEPEPPALLRGLLPAEFQMENVLLDEKTGMLEEHWGRSAGMGRHVIVAKRFAPVDLPKAEQLLTSEFQQYRFGDKRWDPAAEFGERSFRARPSLVAFYKRRTLFTLGYYPENDGALINEIARKLAVNAK